jgi:hypothetical protein
MRHEDNNWIQTFSGKVFRPLAPEQDSIVIEDIAHALSLLCRFSGHVREFYSVAQHSMFVCDAVVERAAAEDPGCNRVELVFAALMHDASEAYCVDVPRPIKRLPALAGYREIEARVEAAINQRFGIAPEIAAHPWIKEADLAVLAAEARDLLATPDQKWDLRAVPYKHPIFFADPIESKRSFLSVFGGLQATRRQSDGPAA